MRVSCPLCGLRDRREFYVKGAALAAPGHEGDAADWHDYLHLRDNPAGRTSELWYHGPCGTWVVVDRDTLTHEVHGARAAEEGLS